MRFPRPLKFAVVSASAIAIAALTALPANASPQTPIAQRYASDHAVASLLGQPKGSEFSVAGGSERDYKWGSLYYSKATGVHEVHGAIWWKYRSMGGPSKFGFPNTDEYKVINNIHGPLYTLGAANKFTSGEIFWNNDGSNLTTWMDTNVSKAWQDTSFPYYGLPTGDEVSHIGYKEASFSDDSDVYVTAKGTFSVISGDSLVRASDINTEYKATGGASGYLGLPTSDSVYDNKGHVQTFGGGAIFNDGQDTGAHAVHGAIYWAYSHNADKSKLGYPTADEAAASGGRISVFEGGSIFWNASTNKTTISYTPPV